jgi:hypothetical protein
MAWIVGDGFDYYGATADVARSVWDSAATTFFSLYATITRFGVGQSIRGGGLSVLLTKTMSSNESVLFAVFAYYRATVLSGTTPEFYVQFRDGATNQCTVVLESGGNLVLKSGAHTGTVLTTYTGAFVQDVWTHFQVKVVIHNTTGAITVRKNGATTDSFTATGLNTRVSANNYANVVVLGEGSATNPTNHIMDDLFFYSGSGAAPNDWVGDVRAVCLPPQVDTAQKDFTPSPAGTATTATAGPTPTRALSADTVYWVGPIVPTRSGTLTKVTANATGAMTGHIQAAIYAADGPAGVPGTLLGASAVVTNPASGNTDLTFAAGPALSSARSYFVAYLTDAAWATFSSGGGALSWYTQARAYAAGFPSPAGTATLATPSSAVPYAMLTVSGNVVTVSEALANGDTDYVFSATVNHADLYDMDDLQFTPQSIVGVVGKVYIKKSDAGARNGQILFKSGGTQVAGPDTVLSSTYTYYSLVQMTDPATGLAWTTPGLAGVQVGQKVTA